MVAVCLSIFVSLLVRASMFRYQEKEKEEEEELRPWECAGDRDMMALIEWNLREQFSPEFSLFILLFLFCSFFFFFFGMRLGW